MSAFAALLVLQIGFSRALAESSLKTGSVVTATEAVRQSPNDPESYRIRSIALAKRRDFGSAIKDLRQAISLRPGDYGLWTQLGRVLDSNGDSASALVAFTEAQRLAPSYGSTCWDTGMSLVKLGRFEEGFKQLRNATLRIPASLPEVMELAWTKYDGNVLAVQRALQPSNNEERAELIGFLLRKGNPDDSLHLSQLTESLSAEKQRKIIQQLVAAKRFAEAHELWQKNVGASKQSAGALEDGGFESGKILGDSAFGWRVDKASHSTPSVALDKSDAHEGACSLRIDWAGNPSPSDEPVSQLLLVEPDTHYELRFASRAQNLITAAAPVVQITDVSGLERPLARSQKLPLGDSEWKNGSVAFATGKLTRAVRIAIQREPCQQSSCPVYGTLWLDDFSVQRQENHHLRAK